MLHGTLLQLVLLYCKDVSDMLYKWLRNLVSWLSQISASNLSKG